MSRVFRRFAATLAAAIAIPTLAAPAAAQCEPEWMDLRGGMVHGTIPFGPGVYSLQLFDDGSGPALYAGGFFRTAGGKPARNVARWDGWSWSPVGAGTNGYITSLAIFDDGSGPALYAGTALVGPHVMRWDGASWVAVGQKGPSGGVHALAVFDDGSGPALYAAGLFMEVDGARMRNIARWDGSSWSAVGTEGVRGMARSLTVFDSALYVGGNIFGADDVSARGVVRWDGESWSALGHESRQHIGDFLAFEVFDDGAGPALYGVAFFCDSTGCPRGGGVLRWDGELWRQVGGTFHGHPYDLAVLDDGTGPALYAGGKFTRIGEDPVNSLARWDGVAWSSVAGGVGVAVGHGTVRALAMFDEGAGPTLFAGGYFQTAGGLEVSNIAAFGCPPPPCYADCNDDGALDFFDFLCFQSLFTAGDPAADCDGSGSIDFLDFLCFQNAFAAGCP